jgi:diguanylate cyclase (GGDEF)-like protein
VTAHPAIERLASEEAARHSDLVSSVTRLVELVGRAGAAGGGAEAARAAAAALESAAAAQRAIAELERRLAVLERLAATDELTGLLNRRGFEAQLKRAMAAASRYQEEGVLVYVDLDGFKPVNDAYGHAAGDEVLRRVARALSESVRPTDYVARLGGDEFAVLLTRTGPADGLRRAESLGRLLNATAVDWRGRTIAVRASLGFQPYGPANDGLEVLRRADDAMYQAKRLRADLGEGRARA